MTEGGDAKEDLELPALRKALRPSEALAEGVSAILSQIPVLSGVQAFYEGRALRLQLERFEEFARCVGERLEGADATALDREYLRSEEFARVFDQVAKRIVNEGDEEKRRLFARVVLGGVREAADRSWISTALQILDRLDSAHVSILSTIFECSRPLEEDDEDRPVPSAPGLAALEDVFMWLYLPWDDGLAVEGIPHVLSDPQLVHDAGLRYVLSVNSYWQHVDWLVEESARLLPGEAGRELEPERMALRPEILKAISAKSGSGLVTTTHIRELAKRFERFSAGVASYRDRYLDAGRVEFRTHVAYLVAAGLAETVRDELTNVTPLGNRFLEWVRAVPADSEVRATLAEDEGDGVT